jgi:uracil-DNA glycosylase family 4
LSGPVHPGGAGGDALSVLRRQAAGCTACPLAQGRHSVVFGEGDPHARLMLVGEAPGQQEDEQGRPFVGAAGQLLDRILAAADIARGEVFITNTVMCRPPGNRVPTEEERATCRPYFDRKMALIRPRLVVLLGATAAQQVLGPDVRITRDRGRPVERDGVTYVPTFHPAALLRDPAKKRPVWEDMQRVRDMYRSLPDAPPPPSAPAGASGAERAPDALEAASARARRQVRLPLAPPRGGI